MNTHEKDLAKFDKDLNKLISDFRNKKPKGKPSVLTRLADIVVNQAIDKEPVHAWAKRLADYFSKFND